jgi:hypothetical protein
LNPINISINKLHLRINVDYHPRKIQKPPGSGKSYKIASGKGFPDKCKGEEWSQEI